jgi:glutaredoxin
MATTRTVEVFSAGCPACRDTIALVERLACPSCEVSVLDMNDVSVARRAKELGIRTVPAVVVDGELASCCRGVGPMEDDLRAAGIGQPLS